MAPDVPAPDLSNGRRGLPLVAVALAPRAFRVRVWAIMSRGQGPRRGCPEGVDVGYPPNTTSPPSSFSRCWPSTRREGPTAASHDDQVNADPLAFLLKERSNMAKAMLTLVLLCMMTGPSMAQEPTVTSLMAKDLTDIPGK